MNDTDNIVKLVEEKDFFVRIACRPVFENGSDNLEVSEWCIDELGIMMTVKAKPFHGNPNHTV